MKIMKKTYRKPVMRLVNAYTENYLLAGSEPDADPQFNVGTNLSGLGGFGGGGSAGFAD